ncbi:FUSC family protein [Streptoalloteichus hindustanus]|uniref:Uncharacterized membrane protein YccC n=1 Tax=Streptoalloteichus hindustanus TaxID=2017 RepID=A0A1M4W9H3_STRHI|nr:FUSC family protein [Streptoalloteichus hindustanus]SHE77612.1 Uncharacterized membrane protein YccC [Streptoalloteichus hindustanus]
MRPSSRSGGLSGARPGPEPASGVPPTPPGRLLLVVLAVTAAATATAAAFGLAEATAIAGLGALFGLTAGVGGPLRSDLRLMSWCGPLLVVALAAGPVVNQVPALAVAVPTLAVLTATVVPLLGWRLELAGGAVLAAVVLSSATGIGAGLSVALRLAVAALGVAFAVVLRVVFGGRDPSATTRRAVAAALTDREPRVLADAVVVWRSDGAPAWLGEALAGAAAMRVARSELEDRLGGLALPLAERMRVVLAEADRVAAQLAVAVRARSSRALPMVDLFTQHVDALRAVGVSSDVLRLIDGLAAGLGQVRRGLADRERGTAEPVPRPRAAQLLGEELRALVTPRSALSRHAARCTLAVLVGALISTWWHSPYASILVMSIFAVLRPMHRDSASVALQRAAGMMLVVGVAAVIGSFTPAPLLVAAFVVLGVVGFPLLQRSHTALTGLLTALVVVLRDVTRTAAVPDLVIGFLTSAAIGATLALAMGYLTLPRPRSNLVDRVRGTMEVVRGLAGVLIEGGAPDAVRAAHAMAIRRTRDLAAFIDRVEDEAEEQRKVAKEAAAALDAVRIALRELAELRSDDRAGVLPALRYARTLLAPPDGRPVRTEFHLPEAGPWPAVLAAQVVVAEALTVHHAALRLEHD